MTDSTSVCLRRALAGDLEARAELMTRHTERLRAFIRPRLGAGLRARESSQDVVQSVIVDAWAGFERLPTDPERFERSGFLRWLLRAADRKLKTHGRFWNRLRRTAQREESGAGGRIDEFFVGPLETPSMALATREELTRIERAFASLPPAWRDVVAMVRLQGLSHREVAQRLGRTESATRTLLSRALARMATALERDAPESE